MPRVALPPKGKNSRQISKKGMKTNFADASGELVARAFGPDKFKKN